MSEDKKLLCVACAGLHPAGPFCPVHPDEPLLDPALDEVRFELMSLDDRARSRTYTRWMVGLGGVGLALAVVTLIVLESAVDGMAAAFWREIVGGGIVAGGVSGFVISKKRFRRRFDRWTKDA